MQPRDLSTHVPYVPDHGTEEVARELRMDPKGLTKLSSNENPHGPSPKTVAVTEDVAPIMSVYPKTAHTDLTERLADKWGLIPGQVWVSFGADGSTDYLTRVMLEPDDRIPEPAPGFSYYSMSARYHHGDAVQYGVLKDDDFEQTADLVLDAYDGECMVYLTAPHNPTGSVLPQEELVELVESVEEYALLVVDEAYGELVEEPSAIDLLSEYDNTAAPWTSSKAYGLVGLRIGYACVPEAWADVYARVNTLFAASEVICRAMPAVLDDEEHVEKSVESAQWSRDYLREYLDVPAWESEGNFVFAEVGDATAVTEAAQCEGVIVRDCGSFGLSECIRVSCGMETQTKRVVDVLNRIVPKVPTA